MAVRWTKTGKTVNQEGTTIIYGCQDPAVKIESRKRHIPHANRVGTWDHTTYFVVVYGVDVKELYSLADAKAYAEKNYTTVKGVKE